MKKRRAILWFPALSALLTAGASGSPAAADAVCRVVSDPLRRLLAFASSPFPFPLFEIALLTLPALPVFAAVRGDPAKWFRRTVETGAVFVSLFLLLSVLPARRSAPPDAPISDAEMTAFASYLAERANGEERLLPETGGEGTPPARLGTVALSDAVTEALRESGLCPAEPYRVKATLFPRLLRRLGLLGYHVFWTGEAVIDPGAPAYTLPFTAAHEAAHQAGIVSEGEASYAAYLALIRSSEPALRYAGWTGALDAVLPALPDGERRAVVKRLFPRVRADLSCFDAVLATGAGAQTVAEGNAAAIRLRGGAGARSYDLFPCLACRLYLFGLRDQADAPAIY